MRHHCSIMQLKSPQVKLAGSPSHQAHAGISHLASRSAPPLYRVLQSPQDTLLQLLGTLCSRKVHNVQL